MLAGSGYEDESSLCPSGDDDIPDDVGLKLCVELHGDFVDDSKRGLQALRRLIVNSYGFTKGEWW